MSEEITTQDILNTMGELIQRVWQTINERIIQPLRRWFQCVWPRIARACRHLARQMHIRRPRHRNTRIQMVQAKRAQLMLPPSGKYAGMTRRESYALAREVQRMGVYEDA